MPAFPNLSSGYVTKYPMTRTRKWRTEVVTMCDLSERRWRKGVANEDFELSFTSVSTADKDTVRTFFVSQRGPFATTWDLTISDPLGTPVTYANCQFLDKTFTATMTKPGRWTFRLRVRTTRGAA